MLLTSRDTFAWMKQLHFLTVLLIRELSWMILCVCMWRNMHILKLARNCTILLPAIESDQCDTYVQRFQELYTTYMIATQHNRFLLEADDQEALHGLIWMHYPLKKYSTYTWYKWNSSSSTILRVKGHYKCCLLYTSPSPRDATLSRMPSSA